MYEWLRYIHWKKDAGCLSSCDNMKSINSLIMQRLLEIIWMRRIWGDWGVSGGIRLPMQLRVLRVGGRHIAGLNICGWWLERGESGLCFCGSCCCCGGGSYCNSCLPLCARCRHGECQIKDKIDITSHIIGSSDMRSNHTWPSIMGSSKVHNATKTTLQHIRHIVDSQNMLGIRTSHSRHETLGPNAIHAWQVEAAT